MPISQEFRHSWISFGLPGIREINTTYRGFNVELLPQLPPISPNLAWLRPLPEALAGWGIKDSNVLTSKDEMAARLSSLRSDAPSTIPESFWILLSNQNLQERITSCTACYFDLSPNLMVSPFRPDDHILRFLNDQQCCFCWYLYIPFDEPPFVCASGGIYSENIETPFLEEIDFAGNQHLVQLAHESCFYVSPDFDAFIYRFWIENLIWFKLNEKIELDPHELEYVRQMKMLNSSDGL